MEAVFICGGCKVDISDLPVRWRGFITVASIPPSAEHTRLYSYYCSKECYHGDWKETSVIDDLGKDLRCETNVDSDDEEFSVLIS